MQPAEINNRQRGFLTIAQNSGDLDYIRLAYALAMSLKASQRSDGYLSIGITPGTVVPERYRWAFDNIIEIPWGDHASASDWKLENEWKCIHMSPYDETIKLDADMLFFNDIASWWELLSKNEFGMCNRVLNYRSQPVTSDYYRKTFTENQLPNVYTAFMYFKKTPATYEIFDLVKYIYYNWSRFFEEHLIPDNRPQRPSTDVIFALAIKILDIEQRFYTAQDIPTFTHMKSRLQDWRIADTTEDWTSVMNVFFNSRLECKIGNYLQFFPLHYHIKHFLTDEMIGYYEQRTR